MSVVEVPIEALAYELAERYVVVRFRAELLWCDLDFKAAGRLAPLRRDVERLRRAVLALAARVDEQIAKEGLDKLVTAVDSFHVAYRNASVGRVRRAKVERLKGGRGDPEHQFYADRYLLKDSPLSRRAWKLVCERWVVLMSVLDGQLRACADLSELLCAELYPTFADGRFGPGARTRSVEDEVVYFRDTLSERVNKLVDKLSEDYPSLSTMKLDGDAVDWRNPLRPISAFHRRFLEALRDLSSVPAYLGLMLDHRQRLVRRLDEPAMLTRSEWKVFKQLVRNATEVCPKKRIQEILGTPHMLAGEEATAKVVSDLRKKLKALGVTITDPRRLGGWQLELVGDGVKRPPTQRSKSGRGKRSPRRK